MIASRRPDALDLAIGAGVGLLATVEAISLDRAGTALAAGVALAVATALRRTLPLVVVPCVAALLASSTLLLDGTTLLAAAVSLAIVVGTCAATTTPARAAPVLGTTLGCVAVAVAIDGSALDVAFASFWYCGPWLVGAALQRRSTRAAAAEARAARAEQEAVSRSERAVQEERLRIARELHDVVAHSLSVVTLQTQVVRRRTDSPEDTAALQAAEDAARSAMGELRGLVSLLREPGADAPVEPQPGLDGVQRLVSTLEDAGVRTQLRLDEGQVPPGVELAAYRILQEAVTNIVRHANAHSATITVEHQGDGLHLRVSDDGQGADARSTPGHGLVGMRERIALYGGTLDFGQTTAGGFEVRAVIPVVSETVAAP